jgi:acyl-CoA reductase-like NAD-dependent aldehyde dehydrogenase
MDIDPRPFLVGGEWHNSDTHLDVVFPYTGEVVDTVCLAGPDDIEAAIRSAVLGFKETRALPSHARSRILLNLCELIDARKDELAEIIIHEAGKTRLMAEAEVVRSIETLQTAAEETKRINGEILPLDWNEYGEGHTGYVRRVPVGPVLGITPFNFPLNLACHKLGPALAAGNPFILKPASKTPISALLLGEMVLEAGMPARAISVLPCSTDLAERMVADPRIAYLSFTGSPSVGWHLNEQAGRKKVGLELGGNAAVIIHEDADIQYAVNRIISGGFANAGQICISVQRVYIHESIYPETTRLLQEAAERLNVGDPREAATQVGPMISESAAMTAYEKIRTAVSEGATVLHGGTHEGALFQPTILTATDPGMEVNCTEMFSPVITLAAYQDIHDAFLFANASDFGLQAGIFTQDINHIQAAFDQLDMGGIIVNDIPTFRTEHMPYGGVKGSGRGREGPRYAIEEMTEMKLMVVALPPR